MGTGMHGPEEKPRAREWWDNESCVIVQTIWDNFLRTHPTLDIPLAKKHSMQTSFKISLKIFNRPSIHKHVHNLVLGVKESRFHCCCKWTS